MAFSEQQMHLVFYTAKPIHLAFRYCHVMKLIVSMQTKASATHKYIFSQQRTENVLLFTLKRKPLEGYLF